MGGSDTDQPKSPKQDVKKNDENLEEKSLKELLDEFEIEVKKFTKSGEDLIEKWKKYFS